MAPPADQMIEFMEQILFFFYPFFDDSTFVGLIFPRGSSADLLMQSIVGLLIYEEKKIPNVELQMRPCLSNGTLTFCRTKSSAMRCPETVDPSRRFCLVTPPFRS